MLTPLESFRQRHAEDWLVGAATPTRSSPTWAALTQQRLQELVERSNSGTPPTVLLTEADPLRFLAGFMAACIAPCPVFLGNPQWGQTEWAEVRAIAQPTVIWGTAEDWQGERRGRPPQYPHPAPILIPTGGSSGRIRFVVHTWSTLMAAVQGFRQYFQVERVNSCCLLPLYHVSGLMQFLRSLTSGGKLALTSLQAWEAGEFPPIDPAEFFTSMVPTQLQRSLQTPALIEWMARFPTVLLGGAPAWEDLLAHARQHRIRVAPTYGMSETASQVATLHPDDFLAGNTSCGRVLPHAQISIASGETRSPIGPLTIRSTSLALGYYGDRPFPQSFQPDDLGYFDKQGYLHIAGRSSDKIITGGENVFPAEVEAAIRATGLVTDVCVLGVVDDTRTAASQRRWGEVVTAVYVARSPAVSAEQLQEQLQRALAGKLSAFKQPKHWRAIAQLPRNAQGKINRAALREWIQQNPFS